MKTGQTVLELFIALLTAEQFFAEYWPGGSMPATVTWYPLLDS